MDCVYLTEIIRVFAVPHVTEQQVKRHALAILVLDVLRARVHGIGWGVRATTEYMKPRLT